MKNCYINYQPQISSKPEKIARYSAACRRAIYYCLQYGVPITHVCNVINAILFELAGTTVDSLPHSSTVSQCVYE